MNIIATLACSLAMTSTPAPAPAQVMVLGSYHMANPGLDLVKSKIRDTLGADRQKEIADLVEMIAKYKPTKIMIETAPENTSYNEKYGKYLEGSYTLTASEIEQVGFRLAKKFGHKQLYGIDHKTNMDFGKVFGFAQANGMSDLLAKVTKTVEKIGQIMEDMDKKYTVPQLLAIHNTPESLLLSQSFYVELVKVAGKGEYPGADMLAEWYRRNLRTYANMRAVTEPGDRVLIIFGAGHAYFLNQAIKESLDLQWVDPLKYLPKPPIKAMDVKFD